ncbi:MAG: type VII toxin-antitoxin system MntA family adenylyltransferase antitoxin [Armatimonadaceae bacterium]
MQIAKRESDAVVEFLREQIPGLRSVHLFGSRATGDWTSASDVDISVLGERPLEPLDLFRIAADLTVFLGAEVDLVDLRNVSTLLKYKIVTEGIRLWALDWRSEDYELAALREKFDWDIQSREHRAEILRSGNVRG